jgi:hypothetical protein
VANTKSVRLTLLLGQMQLKDLHSKPGHRIRHAQQIAVAIFMEGCAEFDLTPLQYAAMVAIRENPGTDATRLSA